MIRRPPTRIELKNEDLLEYDYYQKAEKKRLPPTAQELSKLSRQERIGYVSGTLSARAHFRRVETATAAAAAAAAAVSTPSASASTSGSSGQSTATTTAATATASTAAATAGSESAILNLSSDEGSEEGGNDNESLAESSLVTAEGTPDLSTNMSMEVSD